jgi:hypothetical protein
MRVSVSAGCKGDPPGIPIQNATTFERAPNTCLSRQCQKIMPRCANLGSDQEQHQPAGFSRIHKTVSERAVRRAGAAARNDSGCHDGQPTNLQSSTSPVRSSQGVSIIGTILTYIRSSIPVRLTIEGTGWDGGSDIKVMVMAKTLAPRFTIKIPALSSSKEALEN